MTTTGVRTHGWLNSGRLAWVVAIVLLLALIGWARTAGPGAETEVEHLSPGTVEHVEGSEISVVILTSAGAEKIGLELAAGTAGQPRCRRARGPVRGVGS